MSLTTTVSEREFIRILDAQQRKRGYEPTPIGTAVDRLMAEIRARQSRTEKAAAIWARVVGLPAEVYATPGYVVCELSAVNLVKALRLRVVFERAVRSCAALAGRRVHFKRAG